jgi:phospholipase/carboxylesterase
VDDPFVVSGPEPEQIARLTRPAVGEPAGALVLLHGRGADMNDLFPLLDALDPDRRLLGITPQGPLALPPGGWHWYRLAGIPTPDRETFSTSLEALGAFVDSLPVPVERVVLGGFSQGAVMALALALGAGRPRPAGLLALSGFTPRVEGFALDLDGLESFPTAVAHGALDPVIPSGFGKETATLLRDAGADVRWLESPVPHTIDQRAIPELRQLVAAALP